MGAMTSRRQFVPAALAAGLAVPGRVRAVEPPPPQPVSLALLRAAAGARPRLRRPGGLQVAAPDDADPSYRITAAELLHEHLDADVHFYDLAAPQLQGALAANPWLRVADLSVITNVFSQMGVALNTGLLAEHAYAASIADLSPMFDPEGMRAAVGALYQATVNSVSSAGSGFQAMARLRPQDLDPAAGAVAVAGGTAVTGAGIAMINIGITAAGGATAYSSAAAALLVTGGAALVVIGLGVIGYAIYSVLSSK